MRNCFGLIKNKLKRVLISNTKKILAEGFYELEQKEMERLEKGLQCYLFCRQKSRENCPAHLQERLTHMGHVAFSLIAAFIEEREFKMEYMEFLNDELAAFCALKSESKLNELTIPPTQIGEIALKPNAAFRFSDQESGKLYKLNLDSNNNRAAYKVTQAGG